MARLSGVVLVIWTFLSIQCCLATTIPFHGPPKPPLAALHARGTAVPSRVSNATQAQIDKARAIVTAAIAQAAKLNEARVKKPARNNYKLAPGTIIINGITKRDNGTVENGPGPPPPLLDITDEIAEAAALVAEVDAVTAVNGSGPVVNKRGSFWMANISRKGTIPWGNISPYQVPKTHPRMP